MAKHFLSPHGSARPTARPLPGFVWSRTPKIDGLEFGTYLSHISLLKWYLQRIFGRKCPMSREGVPHPLCNREVDARQRCLLECYRMYDNIDNVILYVMLCWRLEVYDTNAKRSGTTRWCWLGLGSLSQHKEYSTPVFKQTEGEKLPCYEHSRGAEQRRIE